MLDRLEVRPMARDELGLALDWAAGEGWNPGLNDARCFWPADPDGFFLAAIDTEPVGAVSAISYGPTFGFLGLYLVRPNLRGCGIGHRLWEVALDHLAQHRSVGLDAVPAQQANYAQHGFRREHANVRYRAARLKAGTSAGKLEPLSEVPFDALAAYDHAVFGASRETFLTEWISQPGGVALAALDGARVTGYGVLRPCREGFKIGPLFADAVRVAGELFEDLVAHAGRAPVSIDVPEGNRQAVEIVERRGLAPVFHTARMYRGAVGPLDPRRVFGITTLELG